MFNFFDYIYELVITAIAAIIVFIFKKGEKRAENKIKEVDDRIKFLETRQMSLRERVESLTGEDKRQEQWMIDIANNQKALSDRNDKWQEQHIATHSDIKKDLDRIGDKLDKLISR